MVQIHMLVVQCQLSTSPEFAYELSKQNTQRLQLVCHCQIGVEVFIGEIMELLNIEQGEIFTLYCVKLGERKLKIGR